MFQKKLIVYRGDKNLLKAAGQIVTSFVDISFGKGEKRTPTSAPSDGVKAYACEILNLGLLLMEFIDAI